MPLQGYWNFFQNLLEGTSSRPPSNTEQRSSPGTRHPAGRASFAYFQLLGPRTERPGSREGRQRDEYQRQEDDILWSKFSVVFFLYFYVLNVATWCFLPFSTVPLLARATSLSQGHGNEWSEENLGICRLLRHILTSLAAQVSPCLSTSLLSSGIGLQQQHKQADNMILDSWYLLLAWGTSCGYPWPSKQEVLGRNRHCKVMFRPHTSCSLHASHWRTLHDYGGNISVSLSRNGRHA